MKYIILWITLLLCFVFKTQAQTVTQAEYFWDTDPGVGNANAIVITEGESITDSEDISVNGLDEGLHTLFVRVKDENEAWSHYFDILVSVQGTEIFEITKAEYFWDTDPGVGNGAAIAITAGLSIAAQVSISADVDAGIHHLHFRVCDERNVWSLYKRIMVIVEENTIREIVSMEYFWDTDPGVGNAQTVDIDDAILFDGSVEISTAGLSLGDHILHIRVKDESGKWSHYKRVPFGVCETFGALADFETVVEGTNLVATYTGEYAESYQWTLDDVVVSNENQNTLTPIGEQELCLIATNSCGSDTMCAVVALAQLISIDPISLPNNLTQIAQLTGVGFTPDATVHIEKGTETIAAASVTFNSSTSLTATFSFDMETIGLWDVYVNQGTATQLSLPEGLELTTWIGIGEFGKGNMIGEPFPIPASGQVYLPFHFETTQELRWNLYDITGKKLEQKIWQAAGSGSHEISIEHLADGTYYLEVSGDHGSRIFRLVKN